ncbi:hypothetical protein E4U51_000460, partial [Claviceps purpurea]
MATGQTFSWVDRRWSPLDSLQTKAVRANAMCSPNRRFDMSTDYTVHTQGYAW